MQNTVKQPELNVSNEGLINNAQEATGVGIEATPISETVNTSVAPADPAQSDDKALVDDNPSNVITAELEKNNIVQPGIADVSKAVIAIRQSKLPDPKDLGNSGSFFKNPIISREEFEKVQAKFPDIKHFPISETEVKVPAGWLIEQAGFKGKRFGNAGIHVNQALVLVNYGGATGSEILKLSQEIQQEIFAKFGIWIDAEVNII